MNDLVLIAADPPWPYDNNGSRGAAVNHYSTMTVEEIADLDIGELAATTAILFLWCPPSQILEGTGTLIARAWGFEPKQLFVWRKLTKDGTRTKIGLGNAFRAAHETAIVAARGNYRTLIGDKGIANFLEGDALSQDAPLGQHSAKPEAVYDLLDRLVPSGRRADFFARRVRPGWTCIGNELPDGGTIV